MAIESKCFVKVKDLLGENQVISDEKIRELVETVTTYAKSGDIDARIANLKTFEKKIVTQQAQEKLVQKIKEGENIEFTLQQEFATKGNFNKPFEAAAENPDFIVTGGKLSHEKIKNATQAKMEVFLDQSLGDLHKIYGNPKFEKEITITAFKRSRGEEVSGVLKEVSDVADVVLAVDKFSLMEARKSGLIVDELQGHIFKQIHDQVQISSVKQREYIEFMRTLNFDQQRMFGGDPSPKAQNKVFAEIYDSIVSGEFGATNGNSLNNQRQVHFADGESLYNYNQRFGAGNLAEAINRSMSGTAKSIANFQRFGPKPEQTWAAMEKAMAKQIKDKFGSVAEAQFTSGKLKARREKLRKNLFGFGTIPEHNLLTKSLDIAQSVNITSKLMSSVFSTFADHSIALGNFVSKTGAPVFDANARIMKGWVKNLSKADRKKYGQILQTHFDGEVDRYGVMQGLNGKIKKWTNLAMKASLMPQISTVNKSAGSYASSSFLADQGKLLFKDLDPRMQAEMDNFSITAKDWDLARQAIDTSTDTALISPARIEELQIPGVGQQTLFKASQKFAVFLNHQGRMSSPATGLRTRSFMNQGHSPNTVQGKALTSLFQFKSYGLEIAHSLTEIAKANPDVKGQGFFEGLTNASNAKLMGIVMARAKATSRAERPNAGMIKPRTDVSNS